MVVLTMEECIIKVPRIGQRVEVDGFRGTVFYVGTVPLTQGVWLGIDWDDPSRGKHDGVYNGHRYFHARYATSGSLVRIEKVNLGQTIIEALKERYGGTEQIMDEKQKQEIQKAFNASLFEMVGFEKLSCENYAALTTVGLSDHRVASCEESGILARTCPFIEYLDLSRNLINSWQMVADITKGLTRLSALDVSENRLSSNDCSLEKLKDSFGRLVLLNISKLEYSWDDITTCAVMWPQIKKLEASFNNITSLRVLAKEFFQQLTTLNIEGNNIKYWSEVEKLGTLPDLRCLNLCNTGLTEICIDQNAGLFCSLEYILLSDNYINAWESISELNKLKSLREMKFRGNPVLDGIDRGVGRQIVIARIANLKVLNSQEVTNDERRGAEYDYMKSIASALMEIVKMENPSDKASFLTRHPRYPELIKQYGEIEESEIKQAPTSLKTSMKTINLLYENSSLTKQVLPEMTINRLKLLVRRLFSIKSSYLTLVLVSKKNPLLEIDLDCDMKALNYYSVENGDTIKVIV